MDIWNNLTDAFNREMAIEEMNKKYLNTYLVFIGSTGAETVVYYGGYNGEHHVFTDAYGTVIKLKHETDQQIACKFPVRRLFNYKGIALEFVRRPNRQFRRGICKDNVHIYSPVRRLHQSDGHPWEHATIEAALNPVYPKTCEEAIKQLDGKEILSIALNDKFMLSQNIARDCKRYYLFYQTSIIGYFENEVFKIEHKLFSQEVLDNLNLFKPYKVEF